MGKITFILGGARSGKSNFAVELAKKISTKVAFIATCEPQDSEMKQRVFLHQKSRPVNWRTFEAGEEVSSLLRKINGKFEVLIIDCLTLLVSNFRLNNFKENAIKNKVNKMLKILTKIKANSIIVSNEVGLGLVPENKLARDFRDIAGRMNQIVAGKSNEVFFLAAGIPLKIKSNINDQPTEKPGYQK
ncbi:MAG: bifunctional adenosylcobinamide kinase/adenosylcobinamide-phosphate guanylyltransferase [Elusimicrobia bacterium]|nr:bifunctional adenosylcobinamide kinase/adenosylcobinamide-phosphate guanylyltransferase [Elusimicrobiota bacterium]